MLFVGTLSALTDKKPFAVRGGWIAGWEGTALTWHGWISAMDNRSIPLGDYCLNLGDGQEGLIRVTGHDTTSQTGETALFEGQGKLPSFPVGC
jgi:hypothetical protein